MAWFDDLIAIERWPATTVNQTALQLWAASEGVGDQVNNWLAEETPYDIFFAGPPIPPWNVPSYPNEAAGVYATAEFLKGSNYDNVRRFFSFGTNLVDIYLAINQSPWCAGCQGGHYPIQLWERVAPDLASGGSDTIPIDGQTPATLMAQWWSEMASWVRDGSNLVNAALAEAQQLFDQV